jgi:hypothetical protein
MTAGSSLGRATLSEPMVQCRNHAARHFIAVQENVGGVGQPGAMSPASVCDARSASASDFASHSPRGRPRNIGLRSRCCRLRDIHPIRQCVKPLVQLGPERDAVLLGWQQGHQSRGGEIVVANLATGSTCLNQAVLQAAVALAESGARGG